MATRTAVNLPERAIPLGHGIVLILAVKDGRYHAAVYSPVRTHKQTIYPTPEQFHHLRNRDFLPQSQIDEWARWAASADTLDYAVQRACEYCYDHAEWQAIVSYIRSTAWGVDL